MARLFNELKGNYSQIPNQLIEDGSLSDRARFVFCYMASRPDGWEFMNSHLAKILGYSVETLRKYMKELHDAGWVVNKGQGISNGNFSGNTYELKATVSEKTVHGKTRDGKSPTHTKTELSTKTDVKKTDDVATDVARYLHSKVLSLNPSHAGGYNSWVSDIDRAIRIDKRNPLDLHRMINWIYSRDGEFWQPNILSGKKLRAKYDTIFMQMNTGKSKAASDAAKIEQAWLNEDDVVEGELA